MVEELSIGEGDVVSAGCRLSMHDIGWLLHGGEKPTSKNSSRSIARTGP